MNDCLTPCFFLYFLSCMFFVFYIKNWLNECMFECLITLFLLFKITDCACFKLFIKIIHSFFNYSLFMFLDVCNKFVRFFSITDCSCFWMFVIKTTCCVFFNFRMWIKPVVWTYLRCYFRLYILNSSPYQLSFLLLL